nr:MAG TPA: hypothetical protein [Caudoviricetes sp.]
MESGLVQGGGHKITIPFFVVINSRGERNDMPFPPSFFRLFRMILNKDV